MEKKSRNFVTNTASKSWYNEYKEYMLHCKKFRFRNCGNRQKIIYGGYDYGKGCYKTII